jgi:glutamine synthetase
MPETRTLHCRRRPQDVEERGLTLSRSGLRRRWGAARQIHLKVKFFSALEAIGFATWCWLGSSDQLCQRITFTGWHTAHPDAFVQSCRRPAGLSPSKRIPCSSCEFVDRAGRPSSPRHALPRSTGEKMGYAVNAAFEYEFFIFDMRA